MRSMSAQFCAGKLSSIPSRSRRPYILLKSVSFSIRPSLSLPVVFVSLLLLSLVSRPLTLFALSPFFVFALSYCFFLTCGHEHLRGTSDVVFNRRQFRAKIAASASRRTSTKMVRGGACACLEPSIPPWHGLGQPPPKPPRTLTQRGTKVLSATTPTAGAAAHHPPDPKDQAQVLADFHRPREHRSRH